METIKWSKDQIAVEFENCSRLADVITHIENHLQQSQQVVCKIKVNDLTFTDKDEKKFADTLRQDIESLEISFRTSEFLLRDSVGGLVAWIDELKNSVILTAEKFRSNEAAASNYPFSRLITNTEWLIEALQVVKTHITVTERWVACENRLTEAITELETGYKQQDNILIADVLEYEVSMALDQWREILSKAVSS